MLEVVRDHLKIKDNKPPTGSKKRKKSSRQAKVPNKKPAYVALDQTCSDEEEGHYSVGSENEQGQQSGTDTEPEH